MLVLAGVAGKWNHVAAVLFALVEYEEHEKKVLCTDKPQQWNLPCRKSKQSTKPVNTGNDTEINNCKLLC